MDPEAASRIQRIRGWVLVIIGSGLSLGMAVIAFLLGSVVANTGKPGATSEWTGTREFTMHVFELFAVAFVFGVVALAGGIFQLRKGQTSKVAMLLMFGLVALMLYLGGTIANSGH
jgi:MFS family permease